MSCPRCDVHPILLGPGGGGIGLEVSMEPLPPDPELPIIQAIAPVGFQKARVCQQCGTVYCPRVRLPPAREPR